MTELSNIKLQFPTSPCIRYCCRNWRFSKQFVFVNKEHALLQEIHIRHVAFKKITVFCLAGGWADDGKGENIWDRLVHTRIDLITDNSTGDIACDSYHKYQEDIKILKELNVSFYRFSISWSRILPTGTKYNFT